MESIIFAGSVFSMLWLCYMFYKSGKNKNADEDLGLFAFKVNKDTSAKAKPKKWG